MASEGDEAVDIGSLGRLVGYHLRRAMNVVAADFARALDGTGIRQVLFGVLSVVERNPGINQGSVGRSLGIQRANMVALITELVDRGLIDRQVAEGDRRAFALELTSEGRRIYLDCLAKIESHETALLSDLDGNERAALIDLLRKVEASEA